MGNSHRDCEKCIHYDVCYSVAECLNFLPNFTCEHYESKPIKCQDCKYRVKEWREDKRMKEKGYWQYGCSHFGSLAGYWCFGGYDNEFCSDAERAEKEKEDAE